MSKTKKEVQLLDHGRLALIDYMGSDQAICEAARISYSKGTKQVSDDRQLIRYLMRHEHSTPFEMCVVKFYVKAPIFVFRQLHRHRAAAINEASGRYSELPEEFYVPDIDQIRKQSQTNKQGRDELVEENLASHIQSNIKSMGRDEFKHYHWMLDQGVAREISRINLPVSTYSEMYWQTNLRMLFHFLKLRMDEHAQKEIRVYAEAMYEIIKPLFPLACEAFDDYKLNAVTFSKEEIEIIKIFFNEESFYEAEEMPKEEFDFKLSKRELAEFKKKMVID